jgi:hypothetical protein
MLRSHPHGSRMLLSRTWIDRILFALAIGVILAVTAGPSPLAKGLRIILP